MTEQKPKQSPILGSEKFIPESGISQGSDQAYEREDMPHQRPDAPQANDQKDEPWIRDLIVEVSNHETAARACEGMKTHCSYCGEGFPAWPPKELMGHIQVEHAKEVTLQQLNSCAALCSPEWTLTHVQYFTSFIVTFVPLRRRLRDLGLVKFTEPQKDNSLLLDGHGRRLQ